MTPVLPAQSPPLVSIGMPVRNGGGLLAEALRQLLEQTYPHLEILVSDNGSTDETAATVRRLAEKDSRIRYVRQDPPLTAPENFRYVFEHTKGDYFMWAAHDDRHSLNYVELLLNALQARPDAILAFGDLVDFSSFEAFDGHPLDYPFTSDVNMPFLTRLRQVTRRGAHLYGLHRRISLDGWYWHDSDYGWDTALLAFIAMKGAVIKAQGPVFMNYRPANHRRVKSPKQRARENSYKKLAPFFRLRWCWRIVCAGVAAERMQGRRHSKLWNFLRLYLPSIWWPHLRRALFEAAPPFVLTFWRRLKQICRR